MIVLMGMKPLSLEKTLSKLKLSPLKKLKFIVEFQLFAMKPRLSGEGLDQCVDCMGNFSLLEWLVKQ
ncbi:hypothetical protein C5L28_000201 [Lentilactobacillus parakefiri]|uniref:Uncharacterized protein n=1 Tax=Lentilactobacillus parakefiri TaxID=152332 RepID=A0A224V3Y2_9LACO|nr:hypothetical protein C5L28_000201 [Lentilactobacillus parakefiri]GAW71586.1 hypothetical protein LPKJCM_00667 [Lentilactobacillus parakefiri]